MTPPPGNPQASRLRVELGERGYDILVGENLLQNSGAEFASVLSQRQLHIVTDSHLAELHLPSLQAGLDAGGIAHETTVVPAGETSKSFQQLESLAESILASKIDRQSVLVALGGGVIGDLAGFAAAILLRGIDFVQVPTSLLAQVDSSVGGKTGINSRHGKNLIGAFHQPRLVLADCGVLDSLPRRELLAGYAEVVKYGLIGDADFFGWLEHNGKALIDGDRAARRHAILTSCAAKAEVVARDEREGGARALLNLGHTFGHALEAAAGYDGRLLHGEAVAIGMVMAFELSARLGLAPAEDAARLRAHLAEVGLPTSPAEVAAADWTAAALLDHMSRDKKAVAGRVRFILAHGIGRAFIADDVDPGAVESELTRALAA